MLRSVRYALFLSFQKGYLQMSYTTQQLGWRKDTPDQRDHLFEWFMRADIAAALPPYDYLTNASLAADFWQVSSS